MSLAWLSVQRALCALLSARAVFALSRSADRLAARYGWGRGWIGLALLASVTTLPEKAVTLSVLRPGALDMALGNLLGSSLFNVMILAIDDLFYRHGPLLAAADALHAGTAVTAMVMSGLVIIGLVMRPQGRVLRVTSWISIALLSTCLVNVTLVCLSGA